MTRHTDPFGQLSKRTQKLLGDNGIATLRDLCGKSWLEVHRLPGCGYKTGQELDDLIKTIGLIYRIEEPRKDFVDLHEKLEAEYGAMPDFRDMGSIYGISADVMHQIYQGAERAARDYRKTLAAHARWRMQFAEDTSP